MEIRKSDSKGRVVVGNAGQHYAVEHLEGGQILLRPIATGGYLDTTKPAGIVHPEVGI